MKKSKEDTFLAFSKSNQRIIVLFFHEKTVFCHFPGQTVGRAVFMFTRTGKTEQAFFIENPVIIRGHIFELVAIGIDGASDDR